MKPLGESQCPILIQPSETSARDALQRILDWCQAYSSEAFPEVDTQAIRDQIGDNTYSALHASWARHILGGIERIATQALQAVTPMEVAQSLLRENQYSPRVIVIDHRHPDENTGHHSHQLLRDAVLKLGELGLLDQEIPSLRKVTYREQDIEPEVMEPYLEKEHRPKVTKAQWRKSLKNSR